MKSATALMLSTLLVAVAGALVTPLARADATERLDARSVPSMPR